VSSPVRFWFPFPDLVSSASVASPSSALRKTGFLLRVCGRIRRLSHSANPQLLMISQNPKRGKTNQPTDWTSRGPMDTSKLTRF